MSNEHSRIDYQSGEQPYSMAELTNSGDNKTYTTLSTLLVDGANIQPDGVISGGMITPVISGTNNAVSIEGLLVSSNGVVLSVVGVDKTITRASSNVASVSSITVTSAGAIVVIKGSDSVNTSFSEMRGVAGGAPYIPLNSVEIGQIRTSTNLAGVIHNSYIHQTAGAHIEMADFPVFEVNNFNGKVVFDLPLSLIHTGDTPKKVYGEYAKPLFTEQKFSNDFVPAEVSYSSSSEQVYSATIGSSSSSLGQGSFTAILKDGITDPILKLSGQNVMIKYYQDRNKTPHILTQGVIGVSRTFGASDNPKVSITISPKEASTNRAS